MKPKLTLACSVTETHLKEFLLLKFSAELFHDCKWYLSCDDFCANYLENAGFENILAQKFEMESGKVFGTEEEIGNFYKVIGGKFKAAERAILAEGECLLVDSDIIFVGKVPRERFAHEHSALVSPHFQWNSEMDKAWGYFNVGFVILKDLNFLNAWKEETEKGGQFEQVPIQKVIETDEYSVGILPIEFNMGWWRFNGQVSKFRFQSFYLSGNMVCFDGHIVNSFHFHTFVGCHHSEPFKKFVFQEIFARTTDGRLILNEYERLKQWSVR